MAKFQYIVTAEDCESKTQIKALIRRNFHFSSRLMTKLKFQNLVFLNGEATPGWVVPDAGDVLTIKLPEEKSDFPPENVPIHPVYEDDDLLILNKEPGYTVHPTRGHPSHTIANGLMKYMDETDQSFKVRFVNRLDMDTTGLLVIAKNAFAQEELTKQMRANIIHKEYKALVNGWIDDDAFTIDLPIGRPSDEDVRRAVMFTGGYPSTTHVKVAERFRYCNKDYTLVELLLETGRTHQIRVHLSHIGHPLVGDYLYGGINPKLIDRQALHAFRLSFSHPVSNEKLSVEAPLPKDMECLIGKFRSSLK